MVLRSPVCWPDGPGAGPPVAEASPLKRDAALSTLGILMSGGAQFVLSVLVGQWAGPAALGAVRSALSLANTASLLSPSAAGQTASLFVAQQAAAGDEEGAAGVARHLARRAAVALSLLAPTAALVAVLIFGSDAVEAAWVAALVVALGAYQFARGLRFGWGQVRSATVWEAVNTAVTLGLLVVVLVVGNPPWLLAPLVAGNLVYATMAWVGLRRPATAPAAELRGELDRYVLWGMAGTVASTGLLQLSMVLAKAMGPSDEAAGWYAAAISLATPLSMVARALSMALFPEMARQRGRADAAATVSTTHRATWGLVVALTPAFSVLILLSDPLVLLFYGPSFAGAVLPLRILLMAVLWSIVPVAATNSINVRGAAGVRLSAFLSWSGFLIGLALIATLVGRFSVVGVAIGYLVGATATAMGAWVHVWRRDRHRWGILSMWTIGLPAASCASVLWLGGLQALLGAALVTVVGVAFAAVTRGSRGEGTSPPLGPDKE